VDRRGTVQKEVARFAPVSIYCWPVAQRFYEAAKNQDRFRYRNGSANRLKSRPVGSFQVVEKAGREVDRNLGARLIVWAIASLAGDSFQDECDRGASWSPAAQDKRLTPDFDSMVIAMKSVNFSVVAMMLGWWRRKSRRGDEDSQGGEAVPRM